MSDRASTFKYKDFNSHYFAKYGDTETVLKSFAAQKG